MTLAYESAAAASSYEQAMAAVEQNPTLLEHTRAAHQQYMDRRETAPTPAGSDGRNPVLDGHGARLDRAWERLEADRAAVERTRNDGEDRSR